MAAGSIVVDLLMKTGSFETDTQRAQKSLKNFEKSVDDFAVKVGTGVAVAATAMTAMVMNTTRAAEEINRFAQLSGATTESFQMMAAGASTVGIQTDKLADIFKDVQDKVGDFMQTGGGALADFFENIAPKVGVTAEQFRKLSGPQALQLYVSSLEKANLSQSDMIFYLEAIASDSSLLLPLMRDNGKAMQEFGQKAKSTGQIMSDDLIANSIEFRRQVDQITGSLTGAVNVMISQFLPAINNVSKAIGETESNLSFAVVAGKAFKILIETIAILGANIAFTFKAIGIEIGGTLAQFERLFALDFEGFASIPEQIREDSEKARQELDKFEQRVLGFGGKDVSSSVSVVTGTTSTATGETAKQKEAREKATKLALEERKNFDEEMQKLADDEFKYKIKLHEQLYEEQAKEDAAYEAWMTELQAAEEKNRQAIYTKRLEEQEAAEKGYWGRWLENASAAMISFNDLAAGVIQNFTAGFGNAFEKMVFDSQSLSDSFKNLAESMARSIVNALGQMAAQWLAYQAVQLIVGKTTQASASGAQIFQAMAAQQMAAINAFASTAAIPIVGPIAAPAAAATALAATAPFVATVASLSAAAVGARATGGPVSADAPYLVGERGPELFVPNTAGKIISNDQMNKDSGTVINQTINVTTGVQQTVRAEIISLMPQIANAAKSAVADARQRGGSYASSMR